MIGRFPEWKPRIWQPGFPALSCKTSLSPPNFETWRWVKATESRQRRKLSLGVPSFVELNLNYPCEDSQNFKMWLKRMLYGRVEELSWFGSKGYSFIGSLFTKQIVFEGVTTPFNAVKRVVFGRVASWGGNWLFSILLTRTNRQQSKWQDE